jgi:hypothetical protein
MRPAYVLAALLALTGVAAQVPAPEGVPAQQWTAIQNRIFKRLKSYPDAAITEAIVVPIPPGGCPGTEELPTPRALQDVERKMREMMTPYGLTITVQFNLGSSETYRFKQVEGDWVPVDDGLL